MNVWCGFKYFLDCNLEYIDVAFIHTFSLEQLPIPYSIQLGRWWSISVIRQVASLNCAFLTINDDIAAFLDCFNWSEFMSTRDLSHGKPRSVVSFSYCSELFTIYCTVFILCTCWDFGKNTYPNLNCDLVQVSCTGQYKFLQRPCSHSCSRVAQNLEFHADTSMSNKFQV